MSRIAIAAVALVDEGQPGAIAEALRAEVRSILSNETIAHELIGAIQAAAT